MADMKRMAFRGAIVAFLLTTTVASPGEAAHAPNTILIFGAYDHADLTYRVSPRDAFPALTQIAEMAFGAWERAVHAYADSNPSAAHLAGLTVRPALTGEPADIDVVLGALGPTLVGFDVPGGVPHPLPVLAGLDPLHGEAYPSTPAGPGRLVASQAYLPAVWVGRCEGWCGWISGEEGVGPLHTLSQRFFYLVALHEIGHALGLGHADLGTMYGTFAPQSGPTAPGTHCFQQLELEGLATAYRWLTNPEGVFVAPPAALYIDSETELCLPAAPGLHSTLLIDGSQ